MPAISYPFWLVSQKVSGFILFLYINATSTSSQKTARIVANVKTLRHERMGSNQKKKRIRMAIFLRKNSVLYLYIRDRHTNLLSFFEHAQTHAAFNRCLRV